MNCYEAEGAETVRSPLLSGLVAQLSREWAHMGARGHLPQLEPPLPTARPRPDDLGCGAGRGPALGSHQSPFRERGRSILPPLPTEGR